MKVLDWNEVSKLAKDYIDLVLGLANEKFSYLGPRQEIVQEKYSFYKSCLDNIFYTLEDTIFYCNNFPQFDNLDCVKDINEYTKWAKFENKNDTFSGMWDFFGYRIPIFTDDAGQQNFAMFRDAETGELVDICGGAFNTASDDIGYQVLTYIHKEIVYNLKYRVNEEFAEYNIRVE